MTFKSDVADTKLLLIDLDYLATNVLYGRGAMAKEVKRDAVIAIKTLRHILASARSYPDSVEEATKAEEAKAATE